MSLADYVGGSHPTWPPYIIIQGTDDPAVAALASWTNTSGNFAKIYVRGVEPLIENEAELRTGPGGRLSRKKKLRNVFVVRCKKFYVEPTANQNDYETYVKLTSTVFSKQYLRLMFVIGLTRASHPDTDFWNSDLSGYRTDIKVELIEEAKSPNFEQGTEEYEFTLKSVLRGGAL